MGKRVTKEEIAEESRKVRFELHHKMRETEPAEKESEAEYEKRISKIHTKIESLNTNRARDRKKWVAMDLWPVPPEEMAEYPAVIGADATENPTPAPSPKEIDHIALQSHTETDSSAERKDTSQVRTVIQSRHQEANPITPIDLSDREILRRAREILQPFADAAERSWYPSRGQKAEVATTPFSMRLPNELLDKLKTKKGSKGKIVERAIRIYLRLLEEE